MWRALVGVMIACGGCLHDDLVQCESGIACPSSLVCDEKHATCVEPEQLSSCDGQPDLGTCLENGACHDGVCLPVGCGNGRTDPGEACDDGNTASADGCSADCSSNEECGNGKVDPVNRELCDEGDLVNHDGCDSRCSLEEPDWTPYSQLGTHPMREQAAYAYDSARERLVVVGGFEDLGITRVGTTLEWDGVRHTWLDRTPEISPTGRAGASFAYDAQRGVCVLFGGSDFGGAIADTWLWDGEQWTLAATSSGPSARYYASMVYDSERGRMVLFGGRSVSGAPLGDMWQWDGVAWSELTPATLPPRRERAVMAYDPMRDQILLVGGVDGTPKNDSWIFDGTDWARSETLPEVRFGGALVWDPMRAGMQLFGNSTAVERFWDGTTWIAEQTGAFTSRAYPVAYFDSRREALVAGMGYRSNDSVMVGDMQERVAGTWTALSVNPGPGGLQGAMLAYDARRAQVVLYGGNPGTGDRSETFVLERGAWVKSTETIPPPRDRGVMVHDVARDRTVMWGGHSSDANVWEWDGTAWDSIAATPAPSLRQTTAMAYVPGVGSVLVAGDLIPTASAADTWIWDGTAWTDISTPEPGPRIGHAMAYDAKRGELVLFGGANGSQRLGDTWTWTRGGGWVLRTPPTSPSPRSRATMVWDPIREQVLLIGGLIGATRIDEIWAWDGTTWTRVFTDERITDGLVEPAAAYDAVEGAVIVVASNGTYRLQWRGTGADDACATETDRDGDGLVGCEDPDCWALCTPLCPPGTSCAAMVRP